jgi:hypothetical protein
MSLFFPFFLALILPNSGVSSECGAKELEQANVQAERIKTIDDLVKYYRKHLKCGSPNSSEFYAESVSKMLDDNWDLIMKSKKINNSVVQDAIIAGINETWEYRRGNSIASKAKGRCNRNAKRICDAILEMIERAAKVEAELKKGNGP